MSSNNNVVSTFSSFLFFPFLPKPIIRVNPCQSAEWTARVWARNSVQPASRCGVACTVVWHAKESQDVVDRQTDRASERRGLRFHTETERESPSSGQRQNFRRGLKVCGLVVPTRLWLSSPSPSSARTRAGRARPPGNGSSFGATTLTSERCWKSSINPAPPFGCWGPICAPHTPLTKEI